MFIFLFMTEEAFPTDASLLLSAQNHEKHAPRVSHVITAVAKVSCKHGLWLVARVNKKSPDIQYPFLYIGALVRS